MSVAFYGRPSSEGVEELQAPIKDWLKKALEKHRPGVEYLVIYRAVMRYGQVMPRVRVFASHHFADEIIVEILQRESGNGLAYALYVTDESDRAALVEALLSEVASFG